MVTGTTYKSQNGLVRGHAYTVVGVKELTVSGTKHRLIKIRNPWGSERYTGEWNDNDTRWTPQLLE